MAAFDTFIGLEVHIHLLTKTKAFCGCRFEYGAAPNTHVCPVCLGYPGVLPTVNREALKFSYMVGEALNCRLSEKTFFERKNYFYPDMSKNYQISQFQEPVGINGYFEFESGGKMKRVRIHDIHLEEDAGKMIHSGGRSLIDYNRAGTSLLEIVTEPDLSSGEEAEEFLQAFRQMVRYLGVCDGNMEEGSLRCDANISINRPGKGLGTKVEIKNLNSSRNVKMAMRYEEKRQARAKKTGVTIIQETRLWDADKKKTQSMRTKEAAHDYRYFPEPDIPPFIPDPAFLKDVSDAMVELPLVRKARMAAEYGLPEDMVTFLTAEKDRADYYEAVAALGADRLESAKWMKGELAKALSRQNLAISGTYLTPGRFCDLMKLLADGTIHANIAKQILEKMLEEDKDPETLISELGLDAGTDESGLEELVRDVLAAEPAAVEDIRGGNQKAIGFLMGKVMKETKGSADPAAVRSLLMRLLEL